MKVLNSINLNDHSMENDIIIIPYNLRKKTMTDERQM